MTFKENLQEFLNEDEINELLNSLKEEDSHAVILNPQKMSDEEFLLLFPNVKKHPYVEHAYIYDKNEYPLGKNIYHELGCYYLQDPGAMLTASLLNLKESDLVLDLCAAPGGKSIQSSFKMNNKGIIISNDLSKPRTFSIVENVERLGIKNIIVINNDFEKIYQNFKETFDVIILDAPCSGSGMFRKDDKMIEDWSINKVYKFQEIQKRLLEIAYEMLLPGGIISYSTCSYSKEENEDVIHHLLDKSDAEIVTLPNIEGAYINPKDPIGIRIMPHKFNGEGQYICQIRKPGNKKERHYLENENKFKKLFPPLLENKDIQKYGDTYFVFDYHYQNKSLNVIRYGVKLASESKGIIKYDLHFARTLKNDEFPTIELNDKEVIDYIYGNVIYKENDIKGYILLTYKNKSVDISKSDTHQIKNYYPKGLRKRLY